MQTIKNENIDPYDVDGTLVIHQEPNSIYWEDRVNVFDHVTNEYVVVRINRPMVRLLKESKTRGAHVLVWSRGGYQWAESVVKALSLTEYVDTVMSKPLAYFDDTLVEKWLPYRVFIDPDAQYKNKANTLDIKNKEIK